ncbi:MAG: M23 family metallopeptidase [Oscillospiraceae bacterium]|nr:M23 family metallopeptidase [Oscillospiraceae bacterium]
MSNLKFSKGRFARFISSKGFYLAMAVCLAGAGVATYMAVDRTINVIENTANQSGDAFAGFPELEEVEQRVHGVPIERERPPQPSAPSEQQPSSSTSSSSYEELTDYEEPSEPSMAPAVLPVLTYILPVRGDIVAAFSDGELVRNPGLGDWRTHDGIDIRATAGTEVLAAAEGIVLEVRIDPLWGTVVVIDHADGNQTHYSGLAANVPVSAGDTVAARQAIGLLEGVPLELTDRPHLHFAVMRDGAWIDPMGLIGS